MMRFTPLLALTLATPSFAGSLHAGLVPPPAITVPVAASPDEELPAPIQVEPDLYDISREAYLRGRRMHIDGNLLTLVGAPFIGVGLALFINGAFGGSPALAVTGAIVGVGGVGATLGGGVLSNLGAIRATRAVNTATGADVSYALGYGGLGLMLGGAALSPLTAGISALIGIPGSLICGAIQMQQAQQPLRRRRWVMLPTANGVQLLAQF